MVELDQYIRFEGGFPRADWRAISDYICCNIDERAHTDAWNDVSRSWSEMTAEALGEGYWLSESANFIVATAAPEKYVRNLVGFLERARKRILAALPGIAADPEYGKHVAFLFETSDEYYNYISHFYPEEGEFAYSSGLHIRRGNYGHFALPREDLAITEQVVAHELTHACLGHLPIPKWLNEGLAVHMEALLTNARGVRLDRELLTKHKRFWGEAEIQEFWSGESFRRPDDGNHLSYSLAALAVQELAYNFTAFREFTLQAHYRDGGEAAAQDVFEGGLGGLIEQFFGPGPWMPAPGTWRKRTAKATRSADGGDSTGE